MKKIFLIIIFAFMGGALLKADDMPGDQEFILQLDNIKSPFEDGLPKPVVIIKEPVHQQAAPTPIKIPKPVIPPVIKLPALKLQGVMVGEEMHQAIINDQVVPLSGTIKGAKVYSVTKEGVGLLYKGKKFFLNIE